MKIFKKIYIKVDDTRENIEDFISDDIFANINKVLKIADKSKRLDEIEKIGIQAGIKAGNAYFSQYGTLPDDVVVSISESVVKSIGKMNKRIQGTNEKIQKQLKKKTKNYEKRHSEATDNQ